MLGLRFCAWAFSSCSKRGPLFIAVRRPLTVVASLVAEHGLQTRRLSSCGSWAQLLLGMWDLPRPGLEPVSPALAGRFSTTAPPGKPLGSLLKGLKATSVSQAGLIFQGSMKNCFQAHSVVGRIQFLAIVILVPNFFCLSTSNVSQLHRATHIPSHKALSI